MREAGSRSQKSASKTQTSRSMGGVGAKPVVHPGPGSGRILDDAAVMGRSLPEGGCAETVGQLPVDPPQEPGAPAAPTATSAVSTTGPTAHYPGLLGQLAAVRVLVVPQLTTLASCGWLFRLLTALRIRDEQPSRSGLRAQHGEAAVLL